MNDKIIKSAGAVLMLFLAALFGYFFNSIGEENRNAVRFIDIDQDSIESVISSKSVVADKLKIFWDNDTTPIDNIGAFVVKAYNFSDRDFENVLLRIKVASDSGGSPSILYDDYFDKERVSSSVKVEPIVKEKDGSIVYKYTIPTVNRNYDHTPFFTARYFVKDNTKLKTFASIQKKGLEDRKFSLNHFERRTVLQKYGPIVLIIMATLGYILLIYFAAKLSNTIDKKGRKASIVALATKLKENLPDNSDKNSANNLAIDVYYHMNEERWAILPNWFRRLFSTMKPNKDKLIYELEHNK